MKLMLRMRITIMAGSMIKPIMATNITHPAPDLYLPKLSSTSLGKIIRLSSDKLLIAFAATAAHISRMKDNTYS